MEAASFALEAQGKVIPVDGFLAVAGVGEELLEEIAHVRRGQMIVVVFAFPAETDQTDHAHERQMMADGGLRLAEQVAQGRDVQLSLLGQGQDDFQP